MRIVFMGTPQFAVPVLEALTALDGAEVVGVFTQPDRPKGRGNKLAASPVKEAALKAGIHVFQPERIRKTGVEDLKNLKPDLCVTAAFGQILSQEIPDIPPMGNINVHASLLPKHRGSAPIAHAIMAGDRTEFTAFQGVHFLCRADHIHQPICLPVSNQCPLLFDYSSRSQRIRLPSSPLMSRA